MSGIAGIVCSGADPRPGQGAALERMLRALEAKGPDGASRWQEGPASLGLTLFRSTPEQAHEHGPTQVEHVVVVADARLDERTELLDLLEVPAHAHDGIPDSELIARAYLRWGAEGFGRLRGDFALALWDRQQRTLWCARDVFAVRPFYYAELPQGFMFASNFEAFRQSELIAAAVDPVRVHDALTWRWLEFGEPGRTYYRDIMRLPAGHVLRFQAGQLRLQRVDLLRPTRDPLPRDSRELPLLFRHHYKRAVARRLRAERPVASMLSGGLDSGSVVCLAREVLRERGGPQLITCSVLGDPPLDGETPYVRAVQASGDLRCHDLTFARLPELGPVMSRYFERSPCMPVEWAYCQMMLACSVSAREAGARVLLTGETGDIALGVACNPTRRALQEGKVVEAYGLRLEEARFVGWSGRELMTSWLADSTWFLQQDVLQRVSPAFHWARRKRRHAVWRRALQAERPELKSLPEPLAAEFLSRFHEVQVAAEWPNREREDHYFANGVDRGMAGVGEAYDRVCSAHGVEARHPILDRDLVEFCMAVPWRERRLGGTNKSLLRRAEILPELHERQRPMPNVNTEARHTMCAQVGPWLGDRLANVQAAFQWATEDYVRQLEQSFRASPALGGNRLDQVLELIALDAWAGPRAS
ncbi:MAG: asparagine synthase-related protein [Myxococcales bacterium]